MPTITKSQSVPVTVDNFVRAETDKIFASFYPEGFGKFLHFREFPPIDFQPVQRGNRDTLYSIAIFDFDAGPVTISLPDAGKRFMTMLVIDQDHYVFTVMHGSGTRTLTRQEIGTRYGFVCIRILVDPNDPKDVAQVHSLQDSVNVSQSNPGSFVIPNWDEVSRKKIRDALTMLGSTLADWRHAAGHRGQVDLIRHLIVSATGWGLNPDREAIYLNVVPSKNDGTTIYMLRVKDVPVDAFWSVSVYNAAGYFVENASDAYTLNNVTAKKDPDGSVTVQFGGCHPQATNCLPIMKGWNYTVRLYRPRTEILNGSWQFPDAQPVEAIKTAA